MSDIKVGMRFLIDNRTAQCIDVRMDQPNDLFGYMGRYEMYYKHDIKFNDNDEVVVYDGWSVKKLLNALVYKENSGFEIGDYFEIARAGLEPNLRGRLISINEDAERWPYRVADEDGNSASFAFYELTKIHSVISQKRAPKAIETLKAQIKTTKDELEALETALEVLQYASA